MPTVTRTFSLSVPPLQAYSMKLDSSLWHTWIDGAQSPAEVEGDGGPGTVCTLNIRTAGVTDTHRIELVESACDSSGGRYMARDSTSRVRMDETWTFLPEGTGTRGTWTIDYEPVGMTGFFLRPFLPSLLSRSMEQSCRNFEALCSQASGKAASREAGGP
jgi:Polyketide cyclase / dehydrase and lipid transport